MSTFLVQKKIFNINLDWEQIASLMTPTHNRTVDSEISKEEDHRSGAIVDTEQSIESGIVV